MEPGTVGWTAKFFGLLVVVTGCSIIATAAQSQIFMQSLGQKLRDARLSRGLDIDQVSVLTKIPPNFLASIEADDRHALPGGFFYKNWAKQYAEVLSLNVAAIAAEVDNVIAGDAPPVLPGQQTPLCMRPQPMSVAGRGASWRRSLLPVAILMVVVGGCSGLYALWHNRENLLGAAAENAPTSDRSATHDSAPSAVQTVKFNAPKVQVPPQETGQTVDALTGDVQIELAATEQTWLSITPDGKQVFSGVLQPAEVRLIAAHEAATIRVGNAGGITIRLNGKAIGPIGQNGQVRTLVINKAGFQIIEPKPPLVVRPTADASVGETSNGRVSVFTTIQQQ